MNEPKSNRGRPSKTTRSIQVNCSLPEDIVTRMKLHLWSDAEGKVPHGSQSGLIEQALREFFSRLDRCFGKGTFGLTKEQFKSVEDAAVVLERSEFDTERYIGQELEVLLLYWRDNGHVQG